MAIEETDDAGSEVGGGVTSADRTVAVGKYTWDDLRREMHDGGQFDKSAYLGYDPDDIGDMLETAASNGLTLNQPFTEYLDPTTTPVVKGTYTWEHFKQEYYYRNGDQPRDSNGDVVPFDAESYLGFEPDHTENQLSQAEDFATELSELVDERTVDVNPELDEDEFFSTREGHTTVVNRYDLEKSVPLSKKSHFNELERYWVNKPYACAIIFHSRKENEKKYYVIQPHLNPIEDNLKGFLSGKLRTAIKYSEDDVIVKGSNSDRAQVIQREAEQLLSRYDLYKDPISSSAGSGGGIMQQVRDLFDAGEETKQEVTGQLDGLSVRPEPAILEDDPSTLNEYQVEKLLYMLKRDFVGYARIDPVKHDINVEDISCDGYNDGSRAQLTLGREVSDHGTNYTIRQFKDVPFTPIDLINWNTFSLDEMAFLWLCIENNKSLIFAGGTASGKTTSLNAVSLFIPSNSKIVSIEDTREVELPQRNWVASITRPSFGEDDKGDVDEFDLLEAALRQRPDYIVMGEIRGEEGRTLFQVMSTGHTTYTTFHADSVGEVIKRFTTEPINVSKTLFTALDLVSIQTQTRVDGSKVRRNKSLTEINEYSAENDEINVRDVYEWRAETDEYIQMGNSNTLEEIKFDRGWAQEKLDEELFKRKVVLAYLIDQGINTYTEVAATIQAFINDPDTILTLIANSQLERSLEDLREMESVKIDIDPEKEEMVPRPDAPPEMVEETKKVLDNAGPLFKQFKSGDTPDIVSALMDGDAIEETDTEDDEPTEFGQFVPKAGKEADSG